MVPAGALIASPFATLTGAMNFTWDRPWAGITLTTLLVPEKFNVPPMFKTPVVPADVPAIPRLRIFSWKVPLLVRSLLKVFVAKPVYVPVILIVAVELPPVGGTLALQVAALQLEVVVVPELVGRTVLYVVCAKADGTARPVRTAAVKKDR